MGAEGFQYKEFAEDLAGQARAVVPQDLPAADQEYVYKTVHNFCFLAGEALFNDNEHNYTVDEASIITQFIGEWSFHKSLDVIRGGIPPQNRDGILQKIAFTIFEIAKQATFKKMPQDQMIGLVEHHVKKAYNEALLDLAKRGVINQKQAQIAAKQSNIDDMAKADNAALESASDLKVLKLAAFALVAKKLPNDKVSTLLTKFNSSDANVVLQYMQLEDLEQKIDSQLLKQCLEDFQTILPQSEEVNLLKTMRRFGRNLKSIRKSALMSIVEYERPMILEIVKNPEEYKTWTISTPLLNVICSHLEEKINDYKKNAV